MCKGVKQSVCTSVCPVFFSAFTGLNNCCTQQSKSEDEIRYKKCVDNLSEHNQFCSSILHFWSAIKKSYFCRTPCTRTRTRITKLQHNVQSLGTRLAHGYTASKCPSRYPIMKRSLAASASELPVKQRKVKHETKFTRNGWGNMIISAGQ